MKLSGIVCEYNPLHNGHSDHIKFTKKMSDTVVCVMSGNFTQRGAPTCLDKYVRARHAILAGADMVLEIPTVFACASAENFAFGAVKLLNALKCDYLSFGSECGDVELIKSCAQTLFNPCDQFDQSVKKNMAKGVSYPTALYDSLISQDPKFADFSKPNNILAVEYVKTILSLNSKMQPITMERKDNYLDSSLRGKYVSSQAIRNHLTTPREIKRIAKYIPEFVLQDLKPPIDEKYKEFAYTYLATVDKNYLEKIEGISEGLENRILKCTQSGNYDKMMETLKTKRYTYARLQRIILNCVLDIKKQTVKLSKKAKPYTRVLAVSRNRLDLLTLLSNSPINNISHLSANQREMYAVDERAGKVYACLRKESGNKDLSMPLQKV